MPIFGLLAAFFRLFPNAAASIYPTIRVFNIVYNSLSCLCFFPSPDWIGYYPDKNMLSEENVGDILFPHKKSVLCGYLIRWMQFRIFSFFSYHQTLLFFYGSEICLF